MTQREFIKRCAIDANLSQTQVSDILEIIKNSIKHKLIEEGSVQCFGLGKLSIVKRKSKPHYNFKTGELYPAREYQTFKFEPSKDMRSLVTD